jgi:hypothetical protein
MTMVIVRGDQSITGTDVAGDVMLPKKARASADCGRYGHGVAGSG